MRRLSVAFCLLALSCGSKSPTAPTPEPTPTRIIRLLGPPLNFGGVDVGATRTLPFQIINDGNAPLLTELR